MSRLHFVLRLAPSPADVAAASALILAFCVGFLWLGAAGSARAATLDFTGTLSVQIATLPAFVVPGTGTAQSSDDGNAHLLSLSLPGGTFGPVSMSLPVTGDAEISSIRLTLTGNLTGSFGAISGGPPGGAPMGLQGLAKICLIFALGLPRFRRHLHYAVRPGLSGPLPSSIITEGTGAEPPYFPCISSNSTGLR